MVRLGWQSPSPSWAGRARSWDGEPLGEVLRATIEVDALTVTDPITTCHADPERLAWMRANLTATTWVTLMRGIVDTADNAVTN